MNGIPTTHYHADVNLNRVPDAMPDATRKAAQQAIAALKSSTHLTDLPVDVWVDGRHLVRQMRMSFTASTRAARR